MLLVVAIASVFLLTVKGPVLNGPDASGVDLGVQRGSERVLCGPLSADHMPRAWRGLVGLVGLYNNPAPLCYGFLG